MKTEDLERSDRSRRGRLVRGELLLLRKVEEGSALGHQGRPVALLDDAAVGDVNLQALRQLPAAAVIAHDHVRMLN